MSRFGIFSDTRRKLSRSSSTIDLFRSYGQLDGHAKPPKTRRTKRKASTRIVRVRLHATSFFRRSYARRHLKLVQPSSSYLSRYPQTTPFCGAANCHDVTFLNPPLTSESYACVRACVSRCFKPDSHGVRKNERGILLLEAKKNDRTNSVHREVQFRKLNSIARLKNKSHKII